MEHSAVAPYQEQDLLSANVAEMPNLVESEAILAAQHDTRRRASRFQRLVAGIGIMTAALSGCTSSGSESTPLSHTRSSSSSHETNPSSQVAPPTGINHETTAANAQKPNIIFILTDDLSWNLMPYMPNTNRLIRDQGAEMSVEVEQSLCCTSRSTIFTGMYSHNDKVVGNYYPDGGYAAYHKNDEPYALPVWLKNAGYSTSFIGKYLNEYPSPAANPAAGVSPSFVPPGWDHFFTPVAGRPYGQRNEKFSDDGKVDNKFRHRYEDDIFADQAIQDIQNNRKGQPFMLEISEYAPHAPSAFPARETAKFRDIHYPRDPAFNETNMSDKPAPLHDAPALSKSLENKIDKDFRKRVLSIQPVDEFVGRLVHTLHKLKMLKNTFIVFMSDNGYHMGEHREGEGKYDQYQTTLSVPLYVRGPGIKPGTDLLNVPASNVDIASTFADMSGATPLRPVDGKSLLPALMGEEVDTKRNLLIGRGVLPHYSANEPGTVEPPDPTAKRDYNLLRDFQGVYDGRYKYIRLSKAGRPLEEFYDEQTDPFELNNLLGANDDLFNTLSPDMQQQVVSMRKALQQLLICAGITCRTTS